MRAAGWVVVAVAVVAGGLGLAQEKAPFEGWLDELRRDALAAGISQATVDSALAGVEPLPVVVERDRAQAEHVLPLDLYLKRRVDARTVRTGRRMVQEHRGLLAKISDRYEVPPSVLVAVWGLESTFGRFSGVRPTVPALATLAYDNRRGPMFRAELFDALRILDRGDIELPKMKGSWAGAMGQPQFMPSSYLKYAVDFDGDGRRDIWTSRADTFASIANYLQQHGWTKGERWGRAVRLPAKMAAVEEAAPMRPEGCAAVRTMSVPLPLSRWQELGVRTGAGAALPRAGMDASLVRAGSQAYLVYRNYEALLGYNCAHAYALSVALLSDRL
ncbi:MAG TPA: lytic murein transglycosylase [Vicinamibacterales bacterium]|nr:lytic murein transglycosylase [Vicinamibacterales bacterium]